MKFIKAALRHKQVTLSVLLLVFITGIYSLLTMPRREDPKITIRAGLVVAYFPGANSHEVELQVTQKVEEYLFQFNEVKKSKTVSISRDGCMSIFVELNDNVSQPDIFWSTLRHQMLITNKIALPEGVIGPIVNSDFGDTEAMVLAIKSETATYPELMKYTSMLENNIRLVPSVSKIKRIGEQSEEYLVEINNTKLAQLGISLENIVKVIQSQNTLLPAGEIKTGDLTIPITAVSHYQTEADIANQIVGASQTGEVIYLRDISTIKRQVKESQTEAYVDGNRTILLSIQMHENNNIVDFGNAVRSKIEETEKMLPSSVNIINIIDQPSLVDHNVGHFIKEFFIAIIAVILVVLLMLPLRVAAVAATAIPITVSVTFAMLHLFGLELHQVSLAALIVVLGMVVDDAIVIADNYVEKLDEGEKPWDAAWKSASELFIPVLSATITIIAAFLPMALLPGMTGEFIRALPYTVTIALFSSFFIAVLLTPLLCFTFIKKGLHSSQDKPSLKNKILDGMQNGYNKALDYCITKPKTIVAISFFTIILAGLLFIGGVKQKFFPAAERNQFVIEVWLPTGSQVDATRTAVQKLEKIVAKEQGITNYTTFIGTSAPRFYYNYTPVLPTSNFGQIVINTETAERALELQEKWVNTLQQEAPEAFVDVKLMQQGQPLDNPVEIRIQGEELSEILTLKEEVIAIAEASPFLKSIQSNFKEDYFRVNIQLKDEAKRLGFTTESVAKMLYTSANGAPITTMYEGDKAIQVTLKTDEGNKNTNDFTHLNNIYLESPVTHANVPLSQIADLVPAWYTGQIVHRNGIRTLTIGLEPLDHILPSELLKDIRSKINSIALPNGYSIEFGGEYGNQQETMLPMAGVMGISIVLIFFILLFQFQNLKETIIVILTIPLSLFGAILGLVVTSNNFGFTAFIGLIALSGIVVRNAIILVDYARELQHLHGMSIRQSAIEAGKRRLRPIFLTAMAAAIGVVPMIISGSPMWSPLASIIAFGVVWSMITALFTVPIIYMYWIKPSKKTEE